MGIVSELFLEPVAPSLMLGDSDFLYRLEEILRLEFSPVSRTGIFGFPIRLASVLDAVLSAVVGLGEGDSDVDFVVDTDIPVLQLPLLLPFVCISCFISFVICRSFCLLMPLPPVTVTTAAAIVAAAAADLLFVLLLLF